MISTYRKVNIRGRAHCFTTDEEAPPSFVGNSNISHSLSTAYITDPAIPSKIPSIFMGSKRASLND